MTGQRTGLGPVAEHGDWAPAIEQPHTILGREYASAVPPFPWRLLDSAFGYEMAQVHQMNASPRVVERPPAQKMILGFPTSAPAQATWLPAIEQRLRGFLDLPENWNGYGEQRINRQAVNSALGLLSTLGPEIAKPIASPLPDGGVQMEWAHGHSELEIEIRAADPLALFYVDADGNETDRDSATAEEVRGYLASMGYQAH